MSELIVKDNALMNASYNLDLVEQRLILLAILEARESGKGINANDPLTVHAELYQSIWCTQNNGISSPQRCLQGLICPSI